MIKLTMVLAVCLFASGGFTWQNYDAAQITKVVNKNLKNSSASVEKNMKNKFCSPEINEMTHEIADSQDLENLVKSKFEEINNIDLFINWMECNYFNSSMHIIDKNDVEFSLIDLDLDNVEKIAKIIAILPKNTLLKSKDSDYDRWGGGFLNMFRSPTVWDQLHESDFRIVIFSLTDARLLEISSVVVNK